MSNASRVIFRAVNVCLTRQPKLQCRRALTVSSKRLQAKEALAEIPPAKLDDEVKKYEPKIVNLVDEISKLTLREVTNLNELLKSTLGIKDAPVMTSGFAAMPQQAAAEEEEEKEQVIEQSEFSMKLLSFADANKIKVIKAVKLIIPELNLVQSKKLVESSPCLLKEGLTKEEMEKAKESLTEAGAQVEVI